MHFTYHRKLLNPRTKMHTPVNWTTDAKSESKASISWGSMGARANGLRLWQADVAVAIVIALIFQKRFQFKGSWGSCDGWGTRTLSDFFEALMGWRKSISAIISVPGYIFVPNCSSVWRRVLSSFISILGQYKWDSGLAENFPCRRCQICQLHGRVHSHLWLATWERGSKQQGRDG